MPSTSRKSKRLLLIGIAIALLIVFAFPHLSSDMLEPYLPFILIASLLFAAIILLRENIPINILILKSVTAYHALLGIIKSSK